ncbi:MAG: PD-(D/E)XK nuclease family protein [Lentisphaerae bacterium]|nr:PD-(D/E)XK nuclease family protein [Lentisphaerota bacterium]
MKIRASRLPLAFLCPMAATPPETEPSVVPMGDPTPAEVGSAVHAALAYYVQTGEWPDISKYADRYDVPDGEVGMLVSYGATAWGALEHSFPEPKVEQHLELELGPHTLTGTLDVNSAPSLNEVTVLDWKSGRAVHRYSEQLNGYGLLGLEALPTAEKVYAVTVWLRHGFYETAEITRAELMDWKGELVRNVLENQEFRPGPHCGYCGWQGCPGRLQASETALAQIGSAGLIEDLAGETLPADAGERIKDAIDKIRFIRSMADTAYDGIKEAVGRHGFIPTEPGRGFVMDSIPDVKILAKEAWPLFQTVGLTDEEIAACMTVGKTKLLKAVKGKAPRGSKKIVADKFMEDLKNSGALDIGEKKRLAEKAVAKEEK